MQWVARRTRKLWIPISREFEPYQRLPLVPRAGHIILIA